VLQTDKAGSKTMLNTFILRPNAYIGNRVSENARRVVQCGSNTRTGNCSVESDWEIANAN
jgi:hypothetical protein